MGQDPQAFEFVMPDLYSVGFLYRWQGTTALCQEITMAQSHFISELSGASEIKLFLHGLLSSDTLVH